MMEAKVRKTYLAEVSDAVQAVTNQHVEIAFVDQGYTGPEAGRAAAQEGIALCVVKLEEARKGFVLPPKRWVVERSFGWMASLQGL